MNAITVNLLQPGYAKVRVDGTPARPVCAYCAGIVAHTLREVCFCNPKGRRGISFAVLFDCEIISGPRLGDRLGGWRGATELRLR
jgi:hypothetical protein